MRSLPTGEGKFGMNINRLLTLAVILLLAAILLVELSRAPHRRHLRIYVGSLPNRSNQGAEEYFRAACPDMVVVKDEPRADYSVGAAWSDSSKNWGVMVARKGWPFIFGKGGYPDAIKMFRQGCAAIRDDASELADFEEHNPSMPTGRYSLNSANPDRVFMLDTQTGAVWEWEQFENSEHFVRISVEGLYWKSSVR